MNKDRWQPIATVPAEMRQNSTIILLYWPLVGFSQARIATGYWVEEKYHRTPHSHWQAERDWFGVIHAREYQPTHWMPLPPPPEETP